MSDELDAFRLLLGEKLLARLRDRLTAEAVAAERERWTTILTMAKDAANDNADYSHSVRFTVVKALRACRDTGLAPVAEPPAPEPMTVERLLANIRGGPLTWRHGPDSERDLVRLVQEQARKDAAILLQHEGKHPPSWSKDLRTGWKAACRNGQARIRNAAAGLE